MIVQPSIENLNRAAEILRRGGLVAFPTETVYGLGANAFDAAAAKKIYAAKGRPSNNPLIVHIFELAQLKEVAEIPSGSTLEIQIEKLAAFWPGPLTLVLPRSKKVPLEVCAGLDSVAVRIPAHPVATQLLKTCGFPIAAPSANPSGYVSPTRASHVEDSLGDKVELILEGGLCQIGLESSIVSLLGPTPQILRAGAVTLEQLREVLGEVQTIPSLSTSSQKIIAPGMSLQHYSPRTPLRFYNEAILQPLPPKTGIIRFKENLPVPNGIDQSHVLTLSNSGNLNEVANRLFDAIQEADQKGLDLILVDSCKEEGLGLAIMDRLNRATIAS